MKVHNERINNGSPGARDSARVYFFMVQFGSLERSRWLLPDFNSVNNAVLGQNKQAALQIRFGNQSSTACV